MAVNKSRTNIKWDCLDTSDIPDCCGVYAFKKHAHYLYIGQSSNLKRRLSKFHIPFQIALEIPGVKFLFYPTNSFKTLEISLIRELNPEWNGGTSYNSLPIKEKYLCAATGVYCEISINDDDCYVQSLEELALNHPERLRFL